MSRMKCAATLLAMLLFTGCKMCCSYTDYGKPVLDGPYSHVQGRAGSVLSGGYQSAAYGPARELPPLGDPVGVPIPEVME
ncbi:hypothetical protein Pr1d_23660 [Bythopirellula goksoeyrii]|uniref:Lipoprotein n=1 Tax=Bythopirellula goksoeyrii TaxID=1400387 RepID=A0A5B9QBX2_9BACT|nr:hypothetical protein Pr1d_23660 [Bythopirellula goksoeyrii]